MNKLFCNINLFDLTQTIFTVDTQTGDMTAIKEVNSLQDLAPMVATLSYQSSIPEVVLTGNREFANNLKNAIIEYTKLNYSENKIEIEVI